MADEGELSFVATMRDEATAQARAARRQLDSLGGKTKPIEVPVKVDADTKKALAEVKRLQREVRKRKLDVDVTTTKAKAKLAELSGQIAKEKAAIRIDANDAEARARLSRLQAEYDQIRTDVDVEVAPALAEIAAMKAAIAATNAHIEVEVDGAAAVAEAAATRAAIDGALGGTRHVRLDFDSTSLTEASHGVSNLMASILLLGPAVLPILAAITIAAGGLGAGLIAAAGAAGALGLAVAPVVKGMTEAQQSISKLRDKLKDQEKGTDEYRETLKSLRAEQRAFSQSYGPAADGLDVLRKSWAGFKRETQASSVGVIGASLKAAAQVLRMLSPLANAAAGGVRTLIGEFRRWARGPELASILSFFEAEGPGMIVSFGHIAGNVLSGILALFMAFAPEMKSVTGGLEGMTASFRGWAQGLDQSEGFREFLAYARQSLPQVGQLIGNLVLAVVRLAQAFAPFSGPILAAITGILGAIEALPLPVIQGLSIAIAGVVVALKAWQLGVFAVTSAQRVATVATLAYNAAIFTMGRGVGANAAKLGAAGVGIAGVTAAAKGGGGALSILAGAASGALGGAALGAFAGPPGAAIGAAVGGLIGGFTSLGGSTKDAASSARVSIGSWESLKATLDSVTGATTQATKAMIFQDLEKSGALTTLREYGISARDAVSAISGGAGARAAFVAQLDKQAGALKSSVQYAKEYRDSLVGGNDQQALKMANESYKAIKKRSDARLADLDAVKRELGMTEKAIASQKEEIAATRTFTKALKSLPPQVQTAVEAKVLGKPELVDLTRRYKLVPKDVRTLIRENGGTPTRKMVQSIIAEAKRLGGMHPNPTLSARDRASGVISFVGRSLRNLDGQKATTYVDTVRRTRTQVGTGASASGGAGGSLGGTVGREAIRRAMGGTVPGRRLPYGDSVLTYLAPGEEVISNARGQADAYRPLLKAINDGRMALGGTVGAVRAAQSLARGGTSRKRKGKGKRPAGLSVTAAMLDKDTVEQVDAALSSLNTKLVSYFKARGRTSAQAAAASKATLAALKKETAAVRANAAARERVVGLINAAKEAGTRAAEQARTLLDVTSIAAVNDAPMTGGFIVKGLQDRVAALKAFGDNLAALRKRGVDKDLVAQIAQQGVEAGGSYAAALASATGEQLSAVNKAQKDIRAQAGRIGADTTAGLAAGLSSQLKAIDAAGTRLANALLAAVRRRLGIRSPSRVLKGDGINSVRGMTEGILAEIPKAENAGALLAARVAAASVPSIGQLSAMATNASRIGTTSVVRTSEVIEIRHVITSPDGSVSELTAEQVADLIARDPKAAAAIERALRPARRRTATTTITTSDA